MTPDDPEFAAAVIDATRELVAQVAAWARDALHTTDADASVTPVAIPIPPTEPPHS